jgi:sterol 3beta-glucosyltransferase
MKIVILTYGSRGDVQPFLALAVGLKRAGHQVLLAAPHRFADFTAEYGIPFSPLSGDPEVISQRLNDAGANPVRMVRAMSGYIFSIANQVLSEILTLCNEAELIIHSFLFTSGGHSLACQLGVPDISIQTFPVFAPTQSIPPVYLPHLHNGYLRKVFHQLAVLIFWHFGNYGYRRMLKSNPILVPMKLKWPFSASHSRTQTPLVFAVSPMVLPRPREWVYPEIQIPGYFFLDPAEEYQPPARLIEFLASGPMPVCVSFGSMIHRDAEMIYNKVLTALERTGNRVILLSGWSELKEIGASEEVLILEGVPHAWLLPRCKLVIHHGGAGTTAAGLRAGIPNLVIPFAADQPFWGDRVLYLGAGPRPVPVKKLSTERLIEAISASQQESVFRSAQRLGAAIQAEDGVAEMIRWMEAQEWYKSN